MTRQSFEERLLTELRQVVAQNATRMDRAIAAKRARKRWIRIALATALAGVLAIGVAVVLPTAGGPNAPSPAFAVTEDDEGTVIVEIMDITDAKGLERRIEEHGINASVHYLPQDKLCAPPGYDDRLAGRPHKGDLGPEDPVWHQLRDAVRLSEPEPGVIRFTIDRAAIPDGWWLVITAEHDVAEFGPREGQLTPSVAAGFEKGDRDDCQLVDGSIEGWGFQVGVPIVSDEEKAQKSAEREADENT